MRCKKHLPDLTSTVGVCASCLRERLQLIFEVQVQAQTQDQAQPPENEKNLPSLQADFPCSVSPYVSHLKSDTRLKEIVFQTTPEVELKSSAVNDGGSGSEKRRLKRFWILSNLFRTRTNSDQESCEISSSVLASASPPSATTVPARRKNNNRVSDQRRCRQIDRGASPVDNFETLDRSEFVNSSESSPRSRNKTTVMTTARRSKLGYAGKSLASMAFCLSPLVRASPNRNWNKGLGQELNAGGVHHISSAASFCASRSRKLVDLGRPVNKRWCFFLRW